MACVKSSHSVLFAMTRTCTAALPTIALHPEVVETVDAGSTGSLVCVAGAVPMPTIAWFRNGMEISNDSYLTVMLAESFINNTYVQSILEVCPFTSSLAGNFTCLAVNPFGNATFEFQLQVNSGTSFYILSDLVVHFSVYRKHFHL